MLRIDDRLGSYAIAAGEAWIMSVQMKAMVGNAIIDWSTRRLVLSFYGPGRTMVEQIEGVYSSDASGAYFAFVRDGRFSEGLLDKSVQVELAERLLDGRAIIATGSLAVAASSDSISSFGTVIGRVDARFTLYFTPSGLISLIEQDLLPYAGVPITPGPVITTPAGISSDGTPQVGETLTGIDPVGNGPIVARRWIAGASTVAMVQTYAPTAAGSLRYEADLQGPDGTIATSGSTITVQGAVTLVALTGSGALIAGTPSSGTIIGKTAGSTLATTVPGLTITGSSYTFDGTASAGSYGITETLAGATNSPNTTQVVVLAAGSSGGVSWTGVSWTGVSWGGGTTPTTITLSVGSVTSATEGNPGTGSVTLSVGSITTQSEGNPASGITLSVGSITAQPEGN
jgi:hypothetical protein